MLPDGGAVIPACRHELLASPAEDEKTLSVLKEINEKINSDTVAPVKRLSDEPIVFDANTMELRPGFGESAFELKFHKGKKKEKTR